MVIMTVMICFSMFVLMLHSQKDCEQQERMVYFQCFCTELGSEAHVNTSNAYCWLISDLLIKWMMFYKCGCCVFLMTWCMTSVHSPRKRWWLAGGPTLLPGAATPLLPLVQQVLPWLWLTCLFSVKHYRMCACFCWCTRVCVYGYVCVCVWRGEGG